MLSGLTLYLENHQDILQAKLLPALMAAIQDQHNVPQVAPAHQHDHQQSAATTAFSCIACQGRCHSCAAGIWCCTMNHSKLGGKGNLPETQPCPNRAIAVQIRNVALGSAADLMKNEEAHAAVTSNKEFLQVVIAALQVLLLSQLFGGCVALASVPHALVWRIVVLTGNPSRGMIPTMALIRHILDYSHSDVSPTPLASMSWKVVSSGCM